LYRHVYFILIRPCIFKGGSCSDLDSTQWFSSVRDLANTFETGSVKARISAAREDWDMTNMPIHINAWRCPRGRNVWDTQESGRRFASNVLREP
jgi:hypothetical protein